MLLILICKYWKINVLYVSYGNFFIFILLAKWSEKQDSLFGILRIKIWVLGLNTSLKWQSLFILGETFRSKKNLLKFPKILE